MIYEFFVTFSEDFQKLVDPSSRNNIQQQGLQIFYELLMSKKYRKNEPSFEK